MITIHPHAGVNPVLIYERKESNLYTVKVSAMVVSLLHDFMQTHPNCIDFDDIGKLIILDFISSLFRFL